MTYKSIKEAPKAFGSCFSECDFEESHLCGYSNQWNANVNWYIGAGRGQLLHNNMPGGHAYNQKTGEGPFLL